MKFRVGQIVELISNSQMNAQIGTKAKVTRENYNHLCCGVLIDVKWNRCGEKLTQMDGGYYAEHFKPFLQVGEQLLFGFMCEKSGCANLE